MSSAIIKIDDEFTCVFFFSLVLFYRLRSELTRRGVFKIVHPLRDTMQKCHSSNLSEDIQLLKHIQIAHSYAQNVTFRFMYIIFFKSFFFFFIFQ